MPFGWPVEALKAQAVVARSYALAVRKTGAYDLYADTRSQVYGGVAAEKPSTTAAVDATAGQVVLYEGKVATTYFFSTSGGRTASVDDVWSGGSEVPYLVSVPDPYDTASPHHTWGPFAFTGAKLASTFKVPGRLLDVKRDRQPVAARREMTLVGSKGESVVPADQVRTKLGLRSTWFRVGVLALVAAGSAGRVRPRVKLTGVARGGARRCSSSARRRRSGSRRGASRPRRTGALAVAVKPLATTAYRLAVSPTLFTRPVQVSVAPRVRLQPATTPTSLRGASSGPSCRAHARTSSGSSARVGARRAPRRWMRPVRSRCSSS